MKTRLLFFIFACLFTASCKKEKNYSIWTVNGEKFATNNLEVAEGKVISALTSLPNDRNNHFSLGFYHGNLPETGVFFLGYPGPQNGPGLVEVFFRFHGEPYVYSSSEQAELTASSINHKAEYRLEPTWFVNPNNPNDSVLADGIFRVP